MLSHLFHKPIRLLPFLAALLVLPSIGSAQDVEVTRLGGDLTSDLPGRSAIQVFAPNITDEARRVLQILGFDPFHKSFSPKEGLGSTFVNASCAGCHIDNGRGPTSFSHAGFNPGSTMVVKISLPGLNKDRSTRDVPLLGEQLQDHVVKGVPATRIDLAWDSVDGKYPDGTNYKLRKPRLTFRVHDLNTRTVLTSLRMAPPIIGPGLLESVSDDTIREYSDPNDSDHDGISGHPNYVINDRNGKLGIGRFGFRASQVTVEQQTAAALFNDIGITNPIYNKKGVKIEFSEEQLNQITLYQKLAGVPPARNQDDFKVMVGRLQFENIGCNKCHRMTMTTGVVADPELSNQTFHPFTDLLLHDMGKDLADKRAEFSAKGSEWKTTPLWGLGFSKTLATKKRSFFLHDGRARTVEEAILWHGGEALTAQKKFKALSKVNRDALLAFLDSL